MSTAAAPLQPSIAAERAFCVVFVVASILFCRWWQRDAENTRTRNDEAAWSPSASQMSRPSIFPRRTSTAAAALQAAPSTAGHRQSPDARAASPPGRRHSVATHHGSEMSLSRPQAPWRAASRPAPLTKDPALSWNEIASSAYAGPKPLRSPVSGAARREAHLLKRLLRRSASSESSTSSADSATLWRGLSAESLLDTMPRRPGETFPLHDVSPRT